MFEFVPSGMCHNKEKEEEKEKTMKKMLICVCALSLLFGACSIFCTGCGGCSDEELVLTIDEGKSTNVQTNNGEGK